VKKQKIALIGLLLPLVPAAIFVWLSLLSMTSIAVASAIRADKLILLTVALSPVVYALGAVLSISALVRSEPKANAIVAAAINIALLAFLLFFHTSFLAEFKSLG